MPGKWDRAQAVYPPMDVPGVGRMCAITDRSGAMVSIIAYEDNVFTPYLAAPITVITHPVEEMGKKAFSLLMDHMEAKSELAYSKIVIKSQFEIRESVRPI